MVRAWRLAAAALLAVGCGGPAARHPASDPALGGLAPALVVERFLQAANRSDLATMARLFGTRDGPVAERDPRAEVEQRMYALASILRHDDYALEGERLAFQALIGTVETRPVGADRSGRSRFKPS